MDMEEEQIKKTMPPYLKNVLISLALILALALSTLSPAFCDWYTDHIYPILCDVISHITGLFPFAVGEILMYLGILMVIAAILLLPFLIIFRKKARFRRFCIGYYKKLGDAVLGILLTYMITWFVPFNGTVLGQGDPALRTQFTFEEVEAVLLDIIEKGNSAAEEIAIAEDGTVEFYSPEKNMELAAKELEALSGEYGRLSGYYPPVKAAICSDILERMNIGGYNYPYTMEPTNNRYLSPLYEPVLFAHEYSHHKGYYKENEANFLSQLALSRSKDPYLRLSACIDMYYYMFDAYIEARDGELDKLIASGEVVWPEMKTKEDMKRAKEIVKQYFGEDPDLSERAWYINDAGNDVEEERYDEDSHLIDELPSVNKIIEDTATQGWRIQGEILQEYSYDGVVLLLLQYYYKD